MKYRGKKLDRPNEEIVAIPRGDGNDIIIKCKAILDYKKFDALVPEPKPGTKIAKGGKKLLDFEAPTYKADLLSYGKKKYHFMVLESLRDSEIEWESVDMNDPMTWGNYTDELTKAGFSDVEQQRILMGVSDANCLNEAKVTGARERFLAGTLEEALEKSSSLQPEQPSTPSGEVAKPGA